MVQILFVRRAWYCKHFSNTQFLFQSDVYEVSQKNRILTGILCADVLTQFVIAVVYYARIYNLSSWTQFSDVVHTEFAMNCISAFTDTLLGVVVVWLLWRSRSGIRRTDSLINRLVMYMVGSGLVTSIFTVLALVSARVAPNSLIYLLADLVFPKREPPLQPSWNIGTGTKPNLSPSLLQLHSRFVSTVSASR